MNMASMQRINITNIDYKIKKEFMDERNKLKISNAGLFERMWRIYKKNKGD